MRKRLLKNVTGFWVAAGTNATATDDAASEMKALPRPRLEVEQTTEFFVSMAARSHLSGAAVFCA
jgi:hypothetical protein